MRFCNDKHINQVIKKFVKAGWIFENGKHAKLRHPSGKGFVTYSKTPSDHRCLLNIVRDIKRIECSLGTKINFSVDR